ncbi:PUA-like domain-containing protein [Nemania sp. FL0916]|nr:PUA-like domain-containing protein [Nemania sp. FL0916]
MNNSLAPISAAAASQAPPNGAPTTTTVQPPAANDPIFGLNGILYGITIETSGGRKRYRLRTDISRRNHKVYGDNGIALGDWFPLQVTALFRGAHGAHMGGISGNEDTGAYSIVVASHYKELNSDRGNILYYSGSNSLENEDPNQPAPATQGTKCLHASFTSRNPVRVFRSGGAQSTPKTNPHLPQCGLRYDGLYRVVGWGFRTNKNGGRYKRFKLRRLRGQRMIPNFVVLTQTPLAQLKYMSPSVAQISAHNQMRRRRG